MGREVLPQPDKRIATRISDLVVIGSESESLISEDTHAAKDKEPGKYIRLLPDTSFTVGDNVLPGVFVMDVRAPIVDNEGRVNVSSPVPSEAHSGFADLWLPIPDSSENLVFVVGGRLLEPRNISNDAGKVNPDEFQGNGIEGGIDYGLSTKGLPLLIPQGYPHWHGTRKPDSSGGAIVFKLNKELFEVVQQMKDARTALPVMIKGSELY